MAGGTPVNGDGLGTVPTCGGDTLPGAALTSGEGVPSGAVPSLRRRLAASSGGPDLRRRRAAFGTLGIADCLGDALCLPRAPRNGQATSCGLGSKFGWRRTRPRSGAPGLWSSNWQPDLRRRSRRTGRRDRRDLRRSLHGRLRKGKFSACNILPHSVHALRVGGICRGNSVVEHLDGNRDVLGCVAKVPATNVHLLHP